MFLKIYQLENFQLAIGLYNELLKFEVWKIGFSLLCQHNIEHNASIIGKIAITIDKVCIKCTLFTEL